MPAQKVGFSPSFDAWACCTQIISFLEINTPQLKLLPLIATVYAKGIHASENLEKSFSLYNQ
jgi:hypothetical protein